MSDGFDAVQPAGVFHREEKIVDSNTAPRADLFYATIVCSIQMVHDGRMLFLARRTTKNWKEVQKLEARINSLKVLALTLLREVESLEEQGANSAPGPLNLQTEVHRFEAEMIRSALIRTGGRQRRAARLLGMKTTTLNSKIRRYQIEIKEM
jgi:transcriptional regulator with GAF, ATPase, and Fis domain